MKDLLYVNCDGSDHQIWGGALEQAGYRIVTANNVYTAAQIISLRSVDCVVLDYDMLPMDGMAVTQAIKQIRPEVPICVLTASRCVPKVMSRMIDQVICKEGGSEALLQWLISFSGPSFNPPRLEFQPVSWST
jgi:DNA-binding NtrC family response regulator